MVFLTGGCKPLGYEICKVDAEVVRFNRHGPIFRIWGSLVIPSVLETEERRFESFYPDAEEANLVKAPS